MLIQYPWFWFLKPRYLLKVYNKNSEKKYIKRRINCSRDVMLPLSVLFPFVQAKLCKIAVTNKASGIIFILEDTY